MRKTEPLSEKKLRAVLDKYQRYAKEEQVPEEYAYTLSVLDGIRKDMELL